MRDKPFSSSVGDFLAEVFVSDPPTQIQHSALGFWKNWEVSVGQRVLGFLKHSGRTTWINGHWNN